MIIVDEKPQSRWPVSWGQDNRPAAFPIVAGLLGVFAAFAVVMAVRYAFDGNVAFSVLCAFMALVVGLTMPMWWVVGRGRPTGELSGPVPGTPLMATPCTAVPFSRAWGLRWLVYEAVALPVMALAVLVLLSKDLPDLDQGYLVAVSVGGFIAAVIVAAGSGKFKRAYLGVSPEGVRLVAPGTNIFLAWTEIASITPSARHWRLHFHLAATPEHQSGISMLRFRADFLAVDPVRVEKLLRFYFENPELRAELGTAEARERVFK